MIREERPKLPVTRPADWGFKVSVCIGVMCDKARHIIMVSDQLAAFGDFSAEHAVMKNRPFGRRGAALYAGNDPEQAPIILDEAFRKSEKLKVFDPELVAEVLDECYHDRLNYLVEKKVLRKYGLTVKSFIDSGKKKLTDSLHSRLCERIDRVNLSLRFLLCGFSEHGAASIFSCGGGEGVRDHTELGCWAIGRGEPAALSSLAFRIRRKELSRWHSIEDATYMALEAKFMAESASDVGKSTFVVILGADTSDVRFIHNKNVDKIREQWAKKAARRVVPSIIEMIKASYYEPPDTKDIAEQAAKLSALQKSAGQK